MRKDLRTQIELPQGIISLTAYQLEMAYLHALSEMSPGEVFLDLGCGGLGRSMYPKADELNLDYIGIDRDGPLIQSLSQEFPAGTWIEDNVVVLEKIPDDAIDTAWMSFVAMHLSDMYLLAAVNTILKKARKLVIFSIGWDTTRMQADEALHPLIDMVIELGLMLDSTPEMGKRMKGFAESFRSTNVEVKQELWTRFGSKQTTRQEPEILDVAEIMARISFSKLGDGAELPSKIIAEVKHLRKNDHIYNYNTCSTITIFHRV
jgi:hypothetical protein